MIIGIGNDIIEIERIEKAISKEGFKNKIYTQKELENIQKRGNRTAQRNKSEKTRMPVPGAYLSVSTGSARCLSYLHPYSS